MALWAPNPFNESRATDESVAFTLFYDGRSAGAWTVDVDNAGNQLVLVDPDGTTTIDLTAAAYDTIGELADYINDSVAGWYCIIREAIRSQNTYSSSTYLLDSSGATTGTDAGVDVLWDTSICLFAAICVGREGDESDYITHALDHRSERTIPTTRDGSDTIVGSYQTASAARLSYVAATLTHSGGTPVWEIYRSTQSSDKKVYDSPTGVSSTALGELVEGVDFKDIETLDGERLVVLITGTTGLTVQDISVGGYIGQKSAA